MSSKSKACAETEPALLARAMGEADPASEARLEAHLEECEDCRDECESLGRLGKELDAMRGRECPEERTQPALDRLRARLVDLESRMVSFDVLRSPIGPILVAQSEHGVVLVEYLGRGGESEAVRMLQGHGLEPQRGSEASRLSAELNEYLAGRRSKLDWELDWRLVKSPFRREVLQFTAGIPRGAVVSYAGVAADIGHPKAVRAAAQALRWNPLPIAVPCHRVIGTSGALTGYAGGTSEKKQKLLAVEGVPTVKAGQDFRIQRDAMYVLAAEDKEYCLPSCSAVDRFPHGGLLFASRTQAEAAGLAPCTTCRPDLHPLPGAGA
ncbi:MAG TPA: methylated-DNA--[protein]-cysteine S-methyltransferase [Myxococcaceae bacterium]|nr:methylated-DNA--[protein]-cysteine S-methyltransferase [Myxococcaceae bacterium]